MRDRRRITQILTFGLLNKLSSDFQPIRLLDPECCYKFTCLMANSADQDLLKKPTDLDLHCLQRQGISGFSRTRVNKKPFGFYLVCCRRLHFVKIHKTKSIPSVLYQIIILFLNCSSSLSSVCLCCTVIICFKSLVSNCFINPCPAE